MKPVLILSLGVRGGTVIYAQEVIDRLSIEKTVIVPFGSLVKTPRHNYKWIAHRNVYEFFIYSFTLLPLYMISLFCDLTVNKYSSIYLPYFHYWNIFFVFIFKLFNKKVITTIHDGCIGDKNQNNFKGKILNYLKEKSLYSSDELIFLSEYVKNEFQKKYGRKDDCHVIPHGLIIPEGLRQASRNHNPLPNILFFGQVIRSKGVENLIHACLKMATEKYNKLVIVGKHFYPLGIDRNIYSSSKIVFIDNYVPENEISKFFNEADILVLPYTIATQSGVVTIGVSACIPMVCTKVGGLKDQLVPDAEAIFVNSDSESIKEGILALIDNKELYESISLNLKRKHTSLDWNNIAKSIENVIISTTE
jgi:glycosyltransferase involved in cell wall biosynthesis